MNPNAANSTTKSSVLTPLVLLWRIAADGRVLPMIADEGMDVCVVGSVNAGTVIGSADTVGGVDGICSTGAGVSLAAVSNSPSFHFLSIGFSFAVVAIGVGADVPSIASRSNVFGVSILGGVCVVIFASEVNHHALACIFRSSMIFISLASSAGASVVIGSWITVVDICSVSVEAELSQEGDTPSVFGTCVCSGGVSVCSGGVSAIGSPISSLLFSTTGISSAGASDVGFVSSGIGSMNSSITGASLSACSMIGTTSDSSFVGMVISAFF